MNDILDRRGVPLAQLARPAGRAGHRHVLFSVVDRLAMNWGASQLTAILLASAGPTRIGDVVVQPALDLAMSQLYRASALLRHVPDPIWDAALTAHARAAPGSVLLIGHCPALWPQHLDRVHLS